MTPFFKLISWKYLRIFLLIMACASQTAAAAPINLAGVYEFNSEVDGYRKQMYLTLDFINGTPDFTQVFTTKESNFKVLPKDFMNAKKLKKTFAFTKAPGFGKYREKFLFTNTSEFKLTNPRIVDGYIKADWVDASNEKGECTIIVNPDRSLQILGLTSLAREMTPDNIVMGMVEDRLPAGVTPYITPQPVAEFVVGEYMKSIAKPKVTPFDKEIEFQVLKAEQKGRQVTIDMRLRYKDPRYEYLNITFSGNNCEAETKDGKVYTDFSARTPGTVGDTPAVHALDGKWIEFKILVNNVDRRVDYFKMVKFSCGIAGGFFVDTPFTIIENLPVLQQMPASIKPGASANGSAASQTKKSGGVVTDALCLDAVGPVAEMEVSTKRGLFESIFTYAFDENGHLIAIQDGISTDLGKDDIRMKRDAQGRPLSMTTLYYEMGEDTPYESVVLFSYDSNDRLIKEQHGEGADSWTIAYDLDVDGKATSFTISDANGKEQSKVSYPAGSADKNGNWTSRTETKGDEKTTVTRKIKYRS